MCKNIYLYFSAGQISPDSCQGKIVGTKCLTFQGDVRRNWADAEMTCAANGGHLVSISDSVTQDEVASLLLNNYILDESIWIGAKEQDGLVWHWIEGIYDIFEMGFAIVIYIFIKYKSKCFKAN